jgi:hypothetical protein
MPPASWNKTKSRPLSLIDMTETLRETTVPTTTPNLPKPGRSILHMFADHGWSARLWFLVAVGALIAALIEPYLIISAYRTRERVVILDETGTFHISPLLNFEDATKLQTSQTLLACIALFERNPTGFDYPDLLEKMFLPDALTKAKAILSKERAEFQAKQIHQKVEIFKINILKTRNDQVLVEVEGQLIRAGIFNDQPFTESTTFTARFTLLRNPNLTVNGRFPLAVWQFDIQQ